uniref:Uncharacterized protein n=1 Tax=Arundo donax TaxID=35708 RepID=A0A0A8YIM9_ARUDO
MLLYDLDLLDVVSIFEQFYYGLLPA